MNPRLARRILKVAERAALDAGKLLMRSAGKLRNAQIRRKSANNFVTEIDLLSERLILSRIRRHFPDHAVLAEESGARAGGDITWMIDPIDGTSNFIHNFPLFSISIGVAYRGRAFAGVVYNPYDRELFSAVENGGARLNGRPMRVSRVKRLAKSLAVTGIPFRGFRRFEPYLRSFKGVSLGAAGIRRGGSAALDLAYVACGRLDAYWEMSLALWDIAAGTVLVREAGGKVSDLHGKTSFLESGDILATNGRIHGEMRRFTSKIPPKR